MRSLRSSALVVGSSLALASGALAQQAVQWRVEDGGNGHWYAVTAWGQMTTHSGYVALAESIGGHLATLTSPAEETFVRNVATVGGCSGPFSEAFIGAVQDTNAEEPSGGWRWITGEKFSYTAWRIGEPNDEGGVEDAALLSLAGGWNDGRLVGLTCANAAIIEWSADCNNDGIVDYGQIRSGELTDAAGDNIPDCCQSGAACNATLVHWAGGLEANGHWYELLEYSTHVTWESAQSIAESRGGHLATLTGPEENFFVFSLVPSRLQQPGPWIGGFQPAGSPEPAGGWRWVTGEPFQWMNWNGLAPNNDFCGVLPEDKLHFFNQFGEWNDVSEAPDGCIPPMRSLVIEYSADCNSDGIVDFGQIRSGDLRDLDGNYVPDCCESAASCGCTADVDSSGAVNGVDLAAILNTWGTSGGKYPGADINSDGIVDGADLAEVLNSWGACP